VANLSRVMFALGRLKVATFGLVGSWLLVIVADVVLGELAPPRLVVGALALGTTIGQTAVAIPLVIMTRRIRGPAAVRGFGRATLVGLAATVVGTAAGVGVNAAIPVSGRLDSGGVAALAGLCAVLVFGVVAYLLDRRDLRAFLKRDLGSIYHN
jgi:putative peptidoglycan lipid II flippase